MDRINYRFWQHETWNDPTTPLVPVYCNIVDGCDPSAAVGDFEFCTGLRDKNGNLIYEGDVVKCDRDFDDGRVGLIKKVAFFDGAFCLGNLDGFDWYYLNKFHNIEIIGNVHEQKDEK